jgi:CHAD domain-containing protein
MKHYAMWLLWRILRLEMRLRSCCARLAANTDAEALHDLRVTLRSLRSLLRPLRRMPLVGRLDEAAAALGQLSGPLREAEVLIAELQQHGLQAAAKRRQVPLRQGYAQLLASAELQHLFLLLDALPQFWRLAHREGCHAGLRRRLRRRLQREWNRLQLALNDPAVSPHYVRLLIKRVRYADQAYSGLLGLTARQQRLLVEAQSCLGDWHDRWQWLEVAREQDDLRACVGRWQAELHVAYARALPLLDELRIPVQPPEHLDAV